MYALKFRSIIHKNKDLCIVQLNKDVCIHTFLDHLFTKIKDLFY